MRKTIVRTAAGIALAGAALLGAGGLTAGAAGAQIAPMPIKPDLSGFGQSTQGPGGSTFTYDNGNGTTTVLFDQHGTEIGAVSVTPDGQVSGGMY